MERMSPETVDACRWCPVTPWWSCSRWEIVEGWLVSACKFFRVLAKHDGEGLSMATRGSGVGRQLMEELHDPAAGHSSVSRVLYTHLITQSGL
jgi:hypothetical protein